MKRVLQTTMVVAVAMVAIVNACGESTGPGSVPTAAAAGPDLMVSVGETVMLSVADTVATMGLEHTWTQLSGPDVTDGSGALSGASPMVTVPGTVSTLVFELVIGDGSHESAPDTVAILVLEDAEHALFVSPDGANTNDGTPGAPLGSIQAAIDRAVADGQGADVYVAEGQYEGSLTLGDGVSVYGGYRAEVWSRDVDTYRTAIVGGTQAIVGDAVSELTVSGLVVQSADVEADASRDLRSSYGVVLRNSRSVRLTENTISAGAGGRGEEGFPGWAGQDGESGVDGGNGSCDNENAPGKGGGGGQGWPYSGGAGGGGGTGGSGQDGAWGQGPAGGAPGAGGANNSSDRAGSGSDGGIGDVGGDGSDGDHGVGGTDFGIVHQYFGYLPADGDVGRHGEPGSGGGGGGGGGGQYGGFVDDGAGNGAGGGGGGGGGGYGGAGGGGGGGSFGIVLLASTDIAIVDNEITTSSGGDGGRGGLGGAGGAGGAGAYGSCYCAPVSGNYPLAKWYIQHGRSCPAADDLGSSGYGGDGGHGGHGGHGGGGGGGPSIGILEDVESSTTIGGNSISVGAAGDGGPAADPDVAYPGARGAAGEAVDYKKMS